MKKEFEFPEINLLVLEATNIMHDESMPGLEDDDMGWG